VILRETPLAGLLEVHPERHADERGHFARTYDVEELGPVVQMSTSYNARAGTLRGLHFQTEPHGEDKLVRCTRGAVFDVAVDLRPGSATPHAWYGVELSADNGVALWIPRGFAHGFQTLTDDAEVLYAMSTPYVPGSERGVRWDDPAFAIAWPEPPPGGRIIAERDASYPNVSATT
jgi:dTDP-4-dehydrorhamnose 3,5-epimerase